MNFGFIKSKTDLRDYCIPKTINNDNFPLEFTILKDFPIVKNQENICSCTAHVISSIGEMYDRNNTVFSTGAIYGNRRYTDYIGPGLDIRGALKAVQKDGFVKNDDYNYNEEVPEAIKRFEFTDLNFSDKASYYYQLWNNKEIKQALMNGWAVIGAINWYDAYEILENDTIKFSGKFAGAHAILILGWDKDGWLIQNSWGKYFGNNGRCILPFETEFLETWTISEYEDIDEDEDKKFLKKNIFINIINILINTIKKLIKI